jgi:chaperonin GroEL
MIAAGYNAKDIAAGIRLCATDVIEKISAASRPVKGSDEIMQVATISANGEVEVGKLITDAMNKLGTDGVITVEMAKGFKSDLIIVEGMQINRGYLSPYFVNNTEKMCVEFENPKILICNQSISSIHKISHLLEEALRSGSPILIIANDIDGDAMQGLVVNTTRGNLKACAIRSPGFGNARIGMVDDLSMMLNTDVVDTANDSLENVSLADLGVCSKAIITRDSATFIDCPASKKDIDKRKKLLRNTIKNERLSEDELSVLKIRLARLAGGVGIIRVGGATEGELIERKDRVDDALSATQAAIDEGVVPGGGVCLLYAASNIDIDSYSEKERAGVRVMKNACSSPIKQILTNAGESSDLIISKILDSNSKSFGFNVSSSEFCEMIDSGIIDPSKVARCAVENSVSAACTLLSAGCSMIVDNSE